MAVKVFISHSVAPQELAFVNGVADAAAQRQAVPMIPDRAWNPSVEALPNRIAEQIKDADYVVAIASSYGQHLAWLNQEIAYAKQLLKPLLIVADAGIAIAQDFDLIRIDRANPIATLALVSNKIQMLVNDKQAQALLKGLVIGGLVLLFLKGLKGQ